MANFRLAYTKEASNEASAAHAGSPSEDNAPTQDSSTDDKMEQMIRSKDWSKTPIGPIADWSDSLRTAVNIAINSMHPTCIAWGTALTTIYNDAFRSLLGSRNAGKLGLPLQELWAEVWPAVSPMIEAALQGQSSSGQDVPVRTRRSGRLENAFVTFSNSPILDENGAVMGVFFTCLETTGKMQALRRQKRKKAALENATKNLTDIVNHAAVGILQITLSGHIRLANRNFCEMLARPDTDLLGRHVSEIIFEDDRRAVRQAWRRLLATEETMTLETRFILPDGSHIWASNSISLIANEKGDAQYAVSVIQDITNRKGDEERIRHLATHDPLTSLPNRALLHDRLTQAIEKARLARKQMGVLFLDLNRFKIVNDSLGHDIGDELLRRIATRLNGIVREGDTVARLGGDEFVIVLERIDEVTDITTVAANVLQAVAEPLRLAGHEISVSTSIGACIYPRDGTDAVTLMKHADVAMYQAKEFGAGTFRFYNPKMNVAVLDRLLSETGLQRALERQEFVLHYQPRFSAETGVIVAVEALLRWQHPEKGLISPAEFIPLAEEIGLISKIGEWVLQEACRQNRQWQRKGLPAIPVSVNVSSKQLQSSALLEILPRVLQGTGLESKWLELELTESSLMEDIDQVQKTLLDIRRLGISLSIDDFGTGYSSLNYLRMLPIDYLKIDRTFITGLVNDPDDSSIVSATIALAHEMNLKVVAEGVTTQEQLRFLAERKCDQVQGYMCCRPLPADDLENFLAENKSCML